MQRNVSEAQAENDYQFRSDKQIKSAAGDNALEWNYADDETMPQLKRTRDSET